MEPVDMVVRAGDCPCPGSPHSEEHVYLEPELTLTMAAAGAMAIQTAGLDPIDQQAKLTDAYLPRAIRTWTFLELGPNQRVQPVEITREAMNRLLPWDKGGIELVEQCDSLYSEALVRPLVARLSKLSARTPTGSSTPRSRRTSSQPPKPSSPSSQNGSAVGKPFVVPAR